MPNTEAPLRSLDGKPARASALPVVSVVVPTRNRADFLPYTLKALADQVYPSGRVEVIVVDNSSTDGTEELVRSWMAVYPFPLRYACKENRGPASSRNHGAALARGEIIAFTDSDCMPSPGWLRSAVRALRPNVGVITGPIALQRTEDTHFFFNAQLDPEVWDSGLYRTANLVIPKTVFEAVGGFDEGFALGPGGQLLGGEDSDLGWRIRRTGYAAVFAPGVIITHLATPITPREWMRKPLAVQVLPRLLRTIPELRRTSLWCRMFLSPRNFLFDLAALGLLLAAMLRIWPPLLLTLPFLYVSSDSWWTMFRTGKVHKAGAIFALLVQRYALALGTLLWSSFRYRRVIL